MKDAKPTNKGTFVKSADRTLDLLELISSAPFQLNFTQIAARLEIPKSSLSQLLGNLVARNYLQLDGSRGGYGLGRRLAALAVAAETAVPFRQIIHEVITRLRDQFNETVAYYEVRGDEVEITDRLVTRHALLYTMTIGDRAPLYAHSAGKIALSYMSDGELEAYLNRVDIRGLGPNTLRGKNAVRREVRSVRKAGIAFAKEELAIGICGLAAAVEVDGGCIGILNVAVPVARFNQAMDAAIKASLPGAAAEIAEAAARRRKAESERVSEQTAVPVGAR